MEFVVVVALLGLIPAKVAADKGYSFGAFWLFGAALLIVALPVALLMPPKDTQHVGGALCPSCHERVQLEATVCPHCRRDIAAPIIAGGYCQRCGSRLVPRKATLRGLVASQPGDRCPACG